MTANEMPVDRLKETLLALRRAARPNAGRRSFAHDKAYRAAFVQGILERRKLLRAISKS